MIASPERGGAGGEAAIDTIDLLNWTEGIVLKRSPRPGLIFFAPRTRDLTNQ